VTGCLCGRERDPRAGDQIEVGDILGFSQEPMMRWGRVVGYLKRKTENLSAARVVVREFRPGDGRWPTGGYVRAWMCVPWDHDHPTAELRPAQEPIDWAVGPFRKSNR
jgi:hypothetical protein